MRVHVTDFAERQITETSEYIERVWGRVAKTQFRKRLRHIINLLHRNPNLGTKEPLLAQYTILYRSIVATSQNKIIYVVSGERIDIVAFWDVRREPTTLVDEVMKETGND